LESKWTWIYLIHSFIPSLLMLHYLNFNSKDCASEQLRIRHRTIIRYPEVSPESGVGRECPALDESERCDTDPRCYTYAVNWSSWAPCFSYRSRPQHSSCGSGLKRSCGLLCGSGYRARYGECVRIADGSVVSHDFCENVCLT